MAIYRQGQASMDAQGYVTGYDTKWREQLTLIRPGATIFFLTQPLQAAVITEVISDTSIRAITTGGAVVQKTNYLILLHDSLTVDGLAQDVAETLRYYQSKETEIADALEFFRDFDLDGLKDLVNQVKQGAESAKQSASAAKTSETNAKTSETNAKASENAANASKNAAKTSETNAANSANKAKTEADRAEAAAGSSEAQNRVPYAGTTLKTVSLQEMMKQLRDSVRGGFWRQDSDFTETLPQGAFAPFKYGAGVCGGAGDTFFAINVDYNSAKVKVFAGNNSLIDRNEIKCKELATLSGGALPIDQGGTSSKTAVDARNRLEVMYAKGNSLTTENLNSLKGTKKGFYFTSTSASCTPERNYPVQEAGCLLVEQTAANSNDGCVQTYTTFNSYRVFKRMFNQSSGDTWTKWVEFYSANSSPLFKTQMSAGSGDKEINVGVGGFDVFIRNSKSNKYLQLRDDGNFFYNNAYVMYDGVNKSGSDFNITANNIVVKTTGNGFKIRGTTNDRSQALYLSAVQDNNTRLWYVGKSGNNSDIVLNNDMVGSVILVGSNIELRTPSRNGGIFADGSAVVVRRGNGREFKFENNQTAAQNASILLWGNTTGRPSVVECKLADAYLFYAQQNTDKSRVFNVNGVVQATAFNQTSDRDLKDNIEEIENATESLRKMSGYTYTLKENGLPYAGVIAQEVMEAIPEAVSGFTQYTDLAGPTKDGNQLVGEERSLSVDYGAVTGLLVKVCRESDDRISKLEKEVAELKDLLSKLINNPTTLN